MSDLNQGISVVIPTKNRSQRLVACINSIISQTHLPNEIIVVDDHSTDDTKKIVQDFQGHGVKYVLNERTPGAQGARNQGVLSAKYNWIAFQDSDDLWLPNKLEIQFKQLQLHNFNNKIVIHSAGFKVIPEKNIRTQINQDIFEGDCFNKLLVRQGPLFPTIIAHKEALSQIGLLDEMCPSFQEWDTSIRLAKNNQFIYIAEPLFEWVCHDDEAISKDLRRDIKGHSYVLSKNKENILNIHGSKAWAKVMTELICKAHRFGYRDEVDKIYSELPFTTRQLAKLLLMPKTQYRGVMRLLQISNSIFG